MNFLLLMLTSGQNDLLSVRRQFTQRFPKTSRGNSSFISVPYSDMWMNTEFRQDTRFRKIRSMAAVVVSSPPIR